MITDEQRAQRIHYLGSSDIAPILGLSRYATPISVWAEKTGTLTPDDISDKLQVKLGNKMEAIVAELFEEETGKKVRRVNETIYRKDYPFIACNLDRRVVGENAILEIKTAAAWRKKEFDAEELPGETMVQVYHQLAVTGLPMAYICILIGNTDLIIKEIPRDEKVQSDLIKKEVEFWEKFVIPKAIPTWVTRYDADTLGKLFPTGDETKEIALGDDANKLIESLHGLKADRDNLEGLISKLESELKLMLGDATRGSTGLHEVWWKNVKYSHVDVLRLKNELPQIHARYNVVKPSRRFAYNKIRTED